jgi:hypothetical protein
MITLEIRKMDRIKQGLFKKKKAKLGDVIARISADPDTIDFLVERRDDFGTAYTRAYLYSSSPLAQSPYYSYSDEYTDSYYIVLGGSLEENTKLIESNKETA